MTNDDQEGTNGAPLPRVTLEGQYLKSLSIDSPSAPRIFSKDIELPAISVNCDVNAGRVNKTTYEVTLSLSIEAKAKNSKGEQMTSFTCETKYSGLVKVTDKVGKDDLGRILLVFAPSMMFPFIRRILATSTTDCGFPPLMLEPIDFAARYEESVDSDCTEPN